MEKMLRSFAIDVYKKNNHKKLYQIGDPVGKVGEMARQCKIYFVKRGKIALYTYVR